MAIERFYWWQIYAFAMSRKKRGSFPEESVASEIKLKSSLYRQAKEEPTQEKRVECYPRTVEVFWVFSNALKQWKPIFQWLWDMPWLGSLILRLRERKAQSNCKISWFHCCTKFISIYRMSTYQCFLFHLGHRLSLLFTALNVSDVQCDLLEFDNDRYGVMWPRLCCHTKAEKSSLSLTS